MGKKFTIQSLITVLIMFALFAGISVILADFAGTFFTDAFYSAHLQSLEMMRRACVGDTAEEALDSLPNGGFETYLLLTDDGGIAASSSDTLKGAFIANMDEAVKAKFDTGETFAVRTSLNDDPVILFVEGKTDGFRIAGIVSDSAFSSARRSFGTGIILAEVLSLTVCVAGCLIICLAYKHKEDRISSAVPVKNYVITVTGNGKIISACKLFRKNFRYKNISAALSEKDGSLESAVKEGRNVTFSLIDTKGDRHYLGMAPLWTVGGYKLVGNDITRQYEEYTDLLSRNKFDSVTGLNRGTFFADDWRKACDDKIENKCALAYINIGSRNYYELLVGANKVRSVLKVYCEVLRKIIGDYGKLYFYENEDILLFITDERRRADFVRSVYDIIKEMNKPVVLEGFAYKPDCRMGVVLTDACDENTTVENVLYNAKIALNNAVQNTSGSVYVLHTDKFGYKKSDFTEEGLVERMIDEGEVEVYFQPQYNIRTKKIVGFEALTRLKGSKQREINVQQFMSIAEQYGGMVALGNFVMDKAMAFAKRAEPFGATVSINVSPAQIMQTGFVDNTFAALDKSGVKAENIAIEIVESTMVYSFNEAVSKLNLLREKGMGIHIDDFGVAYSSMLYLKKLPISALKIDKAFIDDLETEDRGTAIVRNIINLASDLGLKCICEGVETEKQSKILQSMGCNVIQGYLFGAAADEETAYGMLKEKNEK